MLDVLEHGWVRLAIQQEEPNRKPLMQKEYKRTVGQVTAIASKDAATRPLKASQIIVNSVMRPLEGAKSVTGEQQKCLVRRGKLGPELCLKVAHLPLIARFTRDATCAE